MAPQRQVPCFSDEAFTRWYARNRSARRPNAGGPRVLLWPDTFNTYFHSETARHALEVLEAAGYDVVVPERALCCGRPLYDYGMLRLAKTFLRRIIDVLRPEIEAGTPVVVLEPSCASVFKDELRNMYPDDEDAKRLSAQVVTFGAFLSESERWQPPRLARGATVHGHCHHKAILGTEPDQTVLVKMGVDAEWLDDGCCGMAGAFGFEAGEHYDVSIQAGELGYLPHVRAADPRRLVVADGFSCREQAAQTTHRQALHLADVVWLAMVHGPDGPDGDLPERAAQPDPRAQRRRARSDAALGLAVLAGGAGVLAARALSAAVRRGSR